MVFDDLSIAALTEDSIPASFGLIVGGIWRSSCGSCDERRRAQKRDLINGKEGYMLTSSCSKATLVSSFGAAWLKVLLCILVAGADFGRTILGAYTSMFSLSPPAARSGSSASSMGVTIMNSEFDILLEVPGSMLLNIVSWKAREIEWMRVTRSEGEESLSQLNHETKKLNLQP